MPKLKDSKEEMICKRIRVALAERNWTQKHLADLMGISYSQMSKLVKNPYSMRFSTIAKAFEKLNIKEI